MKYALGFCCFFALVIGLVNSACLSGCGDCRTICTDEWSVRAQSASTIPEICKNAQTFLSCLVSCGFDASIELQELEANFGSNCDLSGYSGSTSPTVNLLTVLVGPLFAAYRTFRL